MSVLMVEYFKEEYGFLSNFYELPEPIEYEGIKYHTVEAAFQAAKTLDEEQRYLMSQLPPGKAKRAGRKLKLRDDWDQVKKDVMYELLKLKFTIPSLKAQLLAIDHLTLMEGNTWGDKYWGCVRDLNGNWTGQNWLGRLLMKVRQELQD